jgi:hypothetical protein
LVVFEERFSMAVDKLIHKLGTGKFVPKMTILAEPVEITYQTARKFGEAKRRASEVRMMVPLTTPPMAHA